MMKKIQYVPLRKGQMDKYLEMAKRENVYPIIYIGLQCGLRQSELISLPWAAVDFSERVIRGKHHAVDLDEESERLLRTEQAAHPKSDTVFVHPRTGKAYARHQLYSLHCKLCDLARISGVSFLEMQFAWRMERR
jgi:integrase